MKKLKEMSIGGINMKGLRDAKISIGDITDSNEIGFVLQTISPLLLIVSWSLWVLCIIGDRRGLLDALCERDLEHVSRLKNRGL